MKWLKKKKYGSAEPVEFQATKVYQADNLFEPETVSSWKEKGEIVVGTNIERMRSGRAPIGIDYRPIMFHPLTDEQDSPIAEILYSFYQDKSFVTHMNPKTNFIRKAICWISKKNS